jgi:hypothetical protein
VWVKITNAVPVPSCCEALKARAPSDARSEVKLPAGQFPSIETLIRGGELLYAALDWSDPRFGSCGRYLGLRGLMSLVLFVLEQF